MHVWDGAAKTNDVGSKKELRSELVHTLEGPEDGIEWLKWHPSSTVLVGGSQDGTCWMWNVPRGRCMQVFSGHGGYVTCGTFSNNGKKLITGSADSTLRIWNPQTASSVKIGGGKFHTQAITCMDMMAGSPLVLSGGEDGLLGITNVMTAKAVSMLRGNGTSIEALASSSQLNIAAAGTMNGSILLWDTIKGVLRSQVAAHSEAITRLVPHPTAPVLFSSSVDGKVKAWDVRSNQCLKTFCGHLEGILDLAIRADGSLLATASEDGSTSIYDVGTF
ncbi:MAG: WD40 repeat domain-containing protein [archaeon]|nr:WD40 repeat domain-containing protein [archaeon]